MFEIIPSINRPDWQAVESDIKKIQEDTDWVEIDVADGTLSKIKTWNNPEELKNLNIIRPVRFSVHLMISRPDKVLKQWIDARVRRIVFQYEGIKGGWFGPNAKNLIEEISQLCRDNWVEVGLSISPDTSVSAIDGFLEYLDVIQILAVPIGVSSSHFDKSQLEKVKALKALRGENHFRIEWDGGVDPETIKDIKKAGADLVASTSFVFTATEPGKALEALKRAGIGLGI